MSERLITAPTLLSWLLLACLGLIWGSSFMAAKLALVSFDPVTIAAVRILLGALILTVVTYSLGHALPPLDMARGRRVWLSALGMGLFSNIIPFSLLNWGQQFVDSGFAGITMAAVPLLVLPLAHFLVPGDRLTVLKTMGVCLGFVGVVLLVGPRAWLAGDADMQTLGRFACVLAACCYACGAIITRLSPEVHPLSFASAALILAVFVSIPVAIWVEGMPPAMPRPRAVFALLYLGVFPTAVATYLLVYLINSVGPSFLSLVNYQVPIWAALLGVVVLAEALPAEFLLALGIILLGLAISQYGTRIRSKAP